MMGLASNLDFSPFQFGRLEKEKIDRKLSYCNSLKAYLISNNDFFESIVVLISR